jgi:type II secretory pathway component PulM
MLTALITAGVGVLLLVVLVLLALPPVRRFARARAALRRGVEQRVTALRTLADEGRPGRR